MQSDKRAIIIGGGLAGLTCASSLVERGISCTVLEASGSVGGRVQTDEVDGYLLDRGFQVFLTAYPEARRLLDYNALELRAFEPGALIRYGGTFHRFSDPWRRPRHALATALSPVASLGDKLRVVRFRKDVTKGSLSSLYQRPETSMIDRLRSRGFSEASIERFFRPFFGGIFLDRELSTSSRMGEFVFRMFAEGQATLPASGMRRIPEQLAAGLPAGVVRTGCRVVKMTDGCVVLDSGERFDTDFVVVATAAPEARRLLDDSSPTAWQGVSNLYFAASEPPIREPILMLNGAGQGLINNLCVPSQVSKEYAPPGRSLISVTTLGADHDATTLVEEITRELKEWFGETTEDWRHLRTYQIPLALPSQHPPALDPVVKPALVRPGVYVCGDHCDTASINGAMASGRRAAEAVASELTA
jgi:phytoene dehydrogenase-like protein